jgi:thioredoxin reductase
VFLFDVLECSSVFLIKDKPSCFTIKTSNNNNNKYSGCVIILAFGKNIEGITVPNQKNLKARGTSHYCADCD